MGFHMLKKSQAGPGSYLGVLIHIKARGRVAYVSSCFAVNMKGLLFLLVECLQLFPMVVSMKEIPQPYSEKVIGNQIIFRDRGIVVNQATFLHVRIPVHLGEVIAQGKTLTESVLELRKGLASTPDDTFSEMESTYNFSIFGKGYEDLKELKDTNMADGFLMADYLHRLLNETYTRFVGMLKILPTRKSLTDHTLSHNVLKRSVALSHLHQVLAEEESGQETSRRRRLRARSHRSRHLRRRRRFVVGLVALDAANNAGYKVDELVGRFNGFLKTKHAGLVDVVEMLGKSFSNFQLDVSLLVKLQIVLLSQQPHKFMAASVFVNQQIKDAYERVMDAVTSAQSQRLSPKMLSGDDLERLYQVIQTHAQEHECNLFIDKPSDLFQVEVSHLYNNSTQTFFIFLHVPMVKHQNHLVLKEYLPFPLLQSFDLNATVLPDVGDTKYIAVSNDGVKDSGLRGRYRTFTEAELSTCKTLGKLYLCPGRNTLRKSLENTCLGSLMQRDPERIMETCEMKISKPGEHVARLQYNEWMVSTQQPLSANAICPYSKSSNTLRIGQQSKIVLPEDCEIELRDHVLSTDLNLNVDFEVTPYLCEDLSNVFSSFYVDTGRLKEVIHRSLAQRESISTGDLQHLKQSEIVLNDYSVLGKLFSFEGLKSFFTIFTGAGATVMSFVGIGFLIPCLVRQGACTGFMGLAASLFGCGRGSPSRTGSVVSVAESFAKRNEEAEPPRVTFEPDAPSEPQSPPPPYNPFATFPRRITPRLLRGIMKPAQSLMSIASGFRTPVNNRSIESLSSPTAEETSYWHHQGEERTEASTLPCHIGPITRKGQRPSNFICTEHLPETGCAGNMC